jgi:hypothetical protein
MTEYFEKMTSQSMAVIVTQLTWALFARHSHIGLHMSYMLSAHKQHGRCTDTFFSTHDVMIKTPYISRANTECQGIGAGALLNVIRVL